MKKSKFGLYVFKMENRIKIKLTNSYHNTECFVLAKKDGQISHNQAKNAWRKLCGSPKCTCGDVAGCRPVQVAQTSQAFLAEDNKYRLINL